MRKLPVYFLIDVSDSMVGEPLQAVQEGLNAITAQLRNDPYALETAWLGVIAFAGRAEILTPLTELADFQPPLLSVGPGTNLGAGLELLMDCIDRDVQKTTSAKKGDWKPIIFLFTDGMPTENPDAACKRWLKDYMGHASLIAVTFGASGDVPLLEKIANAVLALTSTTPEDFREFFQWVSASLQTSSREVNEKGEDGPKLARHSINLEKAQPVQYRDENYAILPVRCTSRKHLWLAKFAAAKGTPYPWHFIDTYLVDENRYLKLAGKKATAGSITLNDTDTFPACPVCHASGVVHCARCGQLSCLPPKRQGACPWCGQVYDGIREVNNLRAERSKG